MSRLRIGARELRVGGAFAIALVLFGVGTVAIQGFGSAFSVRSMLVLATLLAIAALGQTLVMLLGGIDLSIPFVIGFANVVSAQLYGAGMPFVAVSAIVLVLAIAIGVFNGGLSSSLRLHPLIVTLGTGTVAQAAALLWTKGFPSGSAPGAITAFVSIGGRIGPIPVPWLVPTFIVLAVLVELVLARTGAGRRLFALGANPEAAELALVPPRLTWAVAFGISAAFAAITGILLLGFTGSAYAGVGSPYLFKTIAAVVIGGTALTGGEGGYLGTIGGAMVLTEISTLLIGLGLSPSMVQAMLGVVIIVLVSAYAREAHVRTTI